MELPEDLDGMAKAVLEERLVGKSRSEGDKVSGVPSTARNCNTSWLELGSATAAAC